MTPATHLPRVGSLELHSGYVLVRDASGAVIDRVELEVLAMTVAVACEALRTVARRQWGARARIGRGRLGGSCGQYDVHAPAPVATSIESALRSACEQGGLA